MVGVKTKGKIKAAIVGVTMAISAVISPMSMVLNNEVEAASIDANFAKALQYSLYFYDANMCGTDVGERSALEWRDDCHTYDANVSTPYGTMDLSGGFHDAGDHVKFGLPEAYSAVTLGWGFYEFKDAYTSTGQAAHAQVILDHFAEYFRKSTVMEGGNVKAFCYQVGEGDSDHSYWGAPEAQTTARPAYFATPSNPATDIVGLTVAALAANYANFGNAEDLKYAKALYNFAKSNNKAVATEGSASFYVSKAWQDDMAFAAVWLYKATGESSYKTEAIGFRDSIKGSNPYWDESMNPWPYCWDGVWPGVNAMLGDWSLVEQNLTDATGSNYVFLAQWGSARYNTGLQMVGLIYDKYKGTDKYSSWAKGQMEYLMGNNNQNKCYIVGYNQYSVKYPHHRASSGTSDANITSPQKYVLVGALASGPEDAGGSHNDVTSNYIGNEVTIDYNAAFVGACAGLYLKYGSGQKVDSNIVGVKSTVVNPVTTPTTTVTTTTTTTTTSTSNTTTTPVTTGEGSNKLIVNKQMNRDLEGSKTVEIKIKDLIGPRDKIKSLVIELEASGNIGNYTGGYGFSVTDGYSKETDKNWFQSDNFNQSINSNSGTITLDIDSELGDYIAYDGNFVFGMWWSDQQLVTVKSVTATVETSPEVTTVTTTTPVITTPEVTTVTTTETPVTTTEAPATTTETTPVTTVTTVTTTETPVTTTETTTTTPPVTTPGIDKDKVLYGDVDLDGEVRLNDIIQFNKHFVGAVVLSPTARENANCVYDELLNMSDNMKIANYLVFKITQADLGPRK